MVLQLLGRSLLARSSLCGCGALACCLQVPRTTQISKRTRQNSPTRSGDQDGRKAAILRSTIAGPAAIPIGSHDGHGKRDERCLDWIGWTSNYLSFNSYENDVESLLKAAQFEDGH